MKWKKHGLVYVPDGSLPWAQSHAHLPTPILMDTQTIRIYFASLDSSKFGRTTFIDVSASNPAKILRIAGTVVLDLGEPGAFDDSGAVPSCAVCTNDGTRLYYVGFQRTERVPYMLFTGLALGNSDGSSFTRHSVIPVLDRTAEEPFSRGAPFITRDRGGEWRMWYWSCTHWSVTAGQVHYNTVIRHATSADGIEWRPDPDPCIEPDGQDEFALGRPWVMLDGGTYRMWYSIRSHNAGYRIGYAESSDGVKWVRDDARAGITCSENGWDSEMICYPAILSTSSETYLFYNGNSHGATGFGYAVLGMGA